MSDSNSSSGGRIAIAALALALAGAGAYIVHLSGRVADLEPDAAAAPAENEPDEVAPATADVVTAEQAEAIAAILRGEIDSGRKVWFLAQQNNPDSAAVQAELQAVFEQAGWPVESQAYPAPLKAGITLLAADEVPPSFVNTVHDAISAAGFEVKFLTGYRDYFELKRSEDPSWRGPELAADQPFVVVIGSLPTPTAGDE